MFALNLIRKTVFGLLVVVGAPVLAQDTALVGLDRIEKASPWIAVGRLDAADGGFCTATLIAPNLVLTAAHCTYDSNGSGKPRRAKELTFRAGFRNGKAQAERKVIQIARPEEYLYNSGDTERNIRTDVALLRLARPIETHIINPFIVEPRPISSGTVSVVSYGQGRSELPSLQRECQVLGATRGLMVMDCNVTFGSSGAPVFKRDGQRLRIASVISGTASFDGTRRTVGMALPNMVSALKAQMRANGPAPVAKARRIQLGGGRSGTGAKFVRVDGS
ncbi:trypsin-like serine peptidase [Sulfitobacter sp. SK012]|uniref:trypsin-like serine peptidase n=1 Tax=Sulfitobacter sp. SK012 TaxID=1389005 RepID=UPI0013B3AD20|nr:trypsin-like peptidase domain-containing protein [Sulfitobacter sp. SK012]